MEKNWFEKLFINEAKAAISSRSPSGSSSVNPSTPSDWNASEGEAGYIKNRTHYEDVVETVIVDLTILPPGNAMRSELRNKRVYENEVYAVTFGEAEYKFTVQKIDGIYTAVWDGEGLGDRFVFTSSNTDSPTLPMRVPAVTENTRYKIARLNSTVVQLDKKFIPHEQSDWCVSDETSGAYIKNRTHWAESAMIDFVPETTMQMTAKFYNEIPKPVDDFKAGETYIVNWNDNIYNCVAYYAYKDGDICIGNQQVARDADGWDFEKTIESDEPFFVCRQCYIDGAENVDQTFAFVPEDILCTFSISGKSEIVHKIDPKYLPEGVGYETPTALGEVIYEGVIKGEELTYYDRSDVPNYYSNHIYLPDTWLEEGALYEVIIDGVTYKDVECIYSYYWYLGNHNWTVEETEVYPFTVWYNASSEIYFYFPTGGDHTVKVTRIVAGTVKPIDEKFIPDTIQRAIIPSSTEGSTKKFKIAIDDNGTITAVEV